MSSDHDVIEQSEVQAPSPVTETCQTMFDRVWEPVAAAYDEKEEEGEEESSLAVIRKALNDSFMDVIGPLVKQLEELTLAEEKSKGRSSSASDREASDGAASEAEEEEEEEKPKKTKSKGKKASKEEESSEEEKPKKKKSKKPKTGENRRTDGYHVFLSAKMTTKDKNGNKIKGSLTMDQAIGAWRKMSDAAKQPWNDKASKINKSRGLAK